MYVLKNENDTYVKRLTYDFGSGIERIDSITFTNNLFEAETADRYGETRALFNKVIKQLTNFKVYKINLEEVE